MNFSKEDFQPLRGFADVWDGAVYNDFFEYCRGLAFLNGFTDFIPPVLEKSAVFERNLGEESDVVSKEIYKFNDRNDESLSLRPEFTAGIARAVINRPGIIQNHEFKGSLKLYSYGQLFRYDRPQAGRFRQFNQVNFEVLKNPSWEVEVEGINLAKNVLDFIPDARWIVRINSIGSGLTKAKYEAQLREYFEKYKTDLSEDSVRRLEKNPLRILDSKELKDQEIAQDAPQTFDVLEPEQMERFEAICNELSKLGISFAQDSTLVRGLDYYTSTVFELTDTSTELAFGGGGRYDELIGKMSGGKYTCPAFGFACGVERIVALKKAQKSEFYCLIFHEFYDFGLVNHLRMELKYPIKEILHEGGMGQKLQEAQNLGFNQAIIIGQQEAEKRVMIIKNLSTRESTEVRIG
jgi:histidyl-tRNA synthetase